MAKQGDTYIKITKPDGTLQAVPYSGDSMAFYQHLNNRIHSPLEQWKLETITEKQAADLPYKDEKFVTPKEAQDKVPEMEREIADLKARLAEINSDSTLTPAAKLKEAVAEEKQKASLESATKHKDK